MAYDIPMIQKFLEEHWKKGHSLVKSTELLKFQHLNKETDECNYIVGVNQSTGGIDALVGFIPTSQYDKSLYSQGDYWGAIWKKREDVQNEEINDLGMDVFLKIFEFDNFHSFAAIGISNIAKKIYKAFQCKTDVLSQYYILNSSINEFSIAGGVTELSSYNEKHQSDDGWCFKELVSSEICKIHLQGKYRPLKTVTYFVERYVKHPIYSYQFIGINYQDNLVSLWAARTMNVNGAKALRVVDVLGELGGNLYAPIQEYLQKNQYEYIDLMNYGIPEEIFYQMGFRKLDFDGDLIIPNYFEPFEQRNVKIDIAWKADYENYVAFKGDSDQDRPNVL